MDYKLDGEEASAIADALLHWLESQEIDPLDATRVVTIALVSLIHEVAMQRGLTPKDGGKIIADIIVEAL